MIMRNDSWTIKAYQHKNGKRELVEWGTGFGTRHAREYYQRLYDTNEYSELRMIRVNPEVVLYKEQV
jgi:hypothetical protein